MSAPADREGRELVAALEREARAARALAEALGAALEAVADPFGLEEVLRGAQELVGALHRASALRRAAAGRWSCRAGEDPAGGPEVRRALEERNRALELARERAGALGLAARFGKAVTEQLVRQVTGAGYGPSAPRARPRAVCQA